MINKITQEELESFFSKYTLWEVKENKATRRIKFENYLCTLSFINAVGFFAERINHHPDISFGYNWLQISFQTHDADNQLTKKDLMAIKAVEDLISGD